MALEFKLPDVGEGVAEGEIVKWLVKVGDVVKEHQPIVEVMTDKATVEIPSPAAGTITATKAKEGDTVAVGSVIFVLDTAAGASKGAAPSAPPSSPGRAPQAASTGSASPSNTASGKSSQPASAKPTPQANNDATPTREPASAKQTTPSSGEYGQSKPAGKQTPEPAHSAAEASSGSKPSMPASGGGKTIEFKLPDVGEGIAEGEIVKWLVKPGDVVKEHQAIVEVMTDKATVEVPAPAAGRITALKAKEGQTVPVGSVLFTLETAGATAPARQPASAESAAARQGSAQPASARQTGARQDAAQADGAQQVGARQGTLQHGAAQQAAPARQPALAGAASNAPSISRADDKVLAVPSARRVARDMGIDLASVQGTGRNGIVRRADVEQFASSRSAQPASAPSGQPVQRPAATAHAPTSFAPGERETRLPFRGVRRKIAEAMVRSKFTAPHFTVVEEVDVTQLVKLREEAKTIGQDQGVKITYMAFIMKATALALAKYPMLNAHLDEAAQEMVRFGYVNLGIAMDTDNGLIVPVIKDVQSKGLFQLAGELGELAERTRAGKVRPDDLKGSTFSITNAGAIGGTIATPIINFPDVAILGVHRLMKKPGVVESPGGDRIEVRWYMNFSCSVDHRVADGADGARFLVYLKKLLENPGLLAL